MTKLIYLDFKVDIPQRHVDIRVYQKKKWGISFASFLGVLFNTKLFYDTSIYEESIKKIQIV